MIYKLKSFSCKHFAIHFFLWGNGGPNWRRDHSLWCAEQEAEWTLVGAKSRKSFADAAHPATVPQPKKVRPQLANKLPIRKSAFRRLLYPLDHVLNYYSAPSADSKPYRSQPLVTSHEKSHEQKRRVLRWVPNFLSTNRASSPAGLAPMPFLSTALNPAHSRVLRTRVTGPDPTEKVTVCNRCLNLGHTRKACTNMVRCKICFNYGHVSPSCLAKARLQRKFRPIAVREGERAGGEAINSTSIASLVASAPAPSPSITTAIVQNPSSSPPMANWSVDPRPHLHRGFEVDEWPPHPPLRHEVFVTGCYTLYNEDLAIVRLQPPVNKDDFDNLATALRAFFTDVHQVRVADIQPCPLGDAYVRFNTALEREQFLGIEFRFGRYNMRIIKHDEGENVRSHNLDREAWVMLVGFPEDLKCGSIIAKAVSGFGILMHWHETDKLAHVVAKVYLNDESTIPDSVKINSGVPQISRSWTSPCYVIKRKNVPQPPPEDGHATVGPLHPIPPAAPQWMDPNLPISSEATPLDSPIGSGMNTDNVVLNRWTEHAAPVDSLAENAQLLAPSASLKGKAVVEGSTSLTNLNVNEVQFPDQMRLPMFSSSVTAPRQVLRSVIYGPSIPEDPLVTVVPSLLEKVSLFITINPSSIFLRNLSMIDIVHDLPIPYYFNDYQLLVHLAFILYPQLGDKALEKIALDYMEDEEEEDPEIVVNVDEIEGEDPMEPGEDDLMQVDKEDNDVEILNDPPPVFQTPRRKKALKVKEKIDDSFLRRSKRLANKSQGFKNAESAKEATEAAKIMEDNFNPMPLANIPPPATNVAPHLPQDVIEGIATGFLQIQPEIVSATLLKKDDVDD